MSVRACVNRARGSGADLLGSADSSSDLSVPGESQRRNLGAGGCLVEGVRDEPVGPQDAVHLHHHDGQCQHLYVHRPLPVASHFVRSLTTEGRGEGGREGRNEGGREERREGRKEGGREGRKEGMREGRKE